MLPPKTPGHSQASLGYSLVGSLLLSPGSWCARGSVCALQESISPVLCKFWWLYGGLLVTSSKRAYAIHRSTAPRASSLLQQSTADPYLLRRHPNIVLSQFLWGLWVLVCTRSVWALWASLMCMGFDSKHDFVSPTILLVLLLCPWTWDMSSKLLQHDIVAAPAPTILLGLLCPWMWGIASQLLQCRALIPLALFKFILYLAMNCTDLIIYCVTFFMYILYLWWPYFPN